MGFSFFLLKPSFIQMKLFTNYKKILYLGSAVALALFSSFASLLKWPLK